MERFAAGKVRARRYRNPKIGEFFKEIDLSEKKSTGISKILRELKRNGSPLPEFETDADRTYMITTIKIHEGFAVKNEGFGQNNDRSLTEVLTEVLSKKNYDKILPIIKYLDKNREITPQAAQTVIKKSKSTTYRYLSMLVETGYVEVNGNTNNAVYKLSKK